MLTLSPVPKEFSMKKFNPSTKKGIFIPWRFSPLMLTLALLSWNALAIPSQANPIDEELKPVATKILSHADAQGWENIGILKFQVQVGGQNPSWNVGKLNSLMAVRLENSLVLANKWVFLRNPEKRVGITLNAGEQAVKQFGAIDYLQPQGRAKLLRGTYPLAWGTKKVQVDAFLGGLVKVTPDYSKTTVEIWVFDKENTDLRKDFVSFTVETDPVTLTDLNVPFFTTSREGWNHKKLAKLHQALAKKKAAPIQVPKAEPKLPFEEYLDLKLYYDGKPVEIKGQNGEYQVPTPKETQYIHFSLKAKKEPMGLVLLVNGINTFGKETGREPAQYSKWILKEVNKPYEIHGFYPTNKKMEHFKVLSEDQRMPLPLSDNTKLGRIEVYLFLKSPKEIPQQDLAVSARSVNVTTDSFGEAYKQRLRKIPPVKQGIIFSDPKGKEANVELIDFDNLVYSGAVGITYYKKEEKKK